jgi:acetyl esterase/lipase
LIIAHTARLLGSRLAFGVSFFFTVAEGFSVQPFPGSATEYGGATQYSLTIDDQAVTVLVPGKPAPGKPWVLAPSLYKLDSPPVAFMGRTQLELVQRGLHVVVMDLGNTFGAPSAIARWDGCYEAMTKTYGLSAKVALMGLSRQGLSIARWAAAHPGKVACLYMDKAVCDFKSWPGGKLDVGKGSVNDWAQLQKFYGFTSEAEALAYDQNPVDLAPQLVADGIPIIYLAGEADDVVPYAENGARMEQAYRELGGTFRLIMRQGEGHHPHGLEHPWPVADFVQVFTSRLPPPTQVDVAYGTHPRQVLHFWQAKADRPTPLLFFVHGGGWVGGHRLSGLGTLLTTMLERGISVVSIEYRFLEDGQQDGVEPPVHASLHDAARALQWVRSRAEAWNIDKQRIMASGGSAGACTSLWLAFHDDLADPASPDPVARESTRLLGAAVSGAQTTLDPLLMRQWIPNAFYGSHAFGIIRAVPRQPLSLAVGHFSHDLETFLAQREARLPQIEEYSPFSLATADDPPVYLLYRDPPAPQQRQRDPTHSANFGLLLQERLQQVGVGCELVYPGAREVRHPKLEDYLIERLTSVTLPE